VGDYGRDIGRIKEGKSGILWNVFVEDKITNVWKEKGMNNKSKGMTAL